MSRKEKGLRRIVAAFLSVVLMLTMVCMAPAGDAKAAETGLYITGGMAHVQTIGDYNANIVKENGIDTLVLGTRGRGLRVERINVNISNTTGLTGTLQYRVHIQNVGWTNWINAGTPAGTYGRSYRLEGIQFRLTEELAQIYDVRYCAHIQNYGDNQGWVYNGALAGTTGESKRLEEIKVQIVKKGQIEVTPSISYRVHRQSYGWESNWAKDGEVSGTTGQSKRLEAISITVNDNVHGGGVKYETHVQGYGWMNAVQDGQLSGTQGESKRLEAIRISLTGNLANAYDVYYRVHAQDVGWMGWAKNGEDAGTSGGSKRLEAIQIALVQKGNAAPASYYKGVTAVTTESFKKFNTTSQSIPVSNGANNSCNASFEEEVLRLVNVERTSRGLKALTMPEDLRTVARVRAKETATLFEHTRPDGRSCFTALDDAGIDYWTCGENIAMGYATPQSVVNGWMNSDGHRRNILNPSFEELGVGCYKNSSGRYCWAQMFLTR